MPSANITLLRGDCFTDINITETVSLIVTDPPYDIGRINMGGTVNNIKKLNTSMFSLTKTSDMTLGYDISAFANLVRLWQGPNINTYFFCNKAQIAEYFRIYVLRMGCKFDIITWHKQNALPTYYNKYLADTEYVLHF